MLGAAFSLELPCQAAAAPTCRGLSCQQVTEGKEPTYPGASAPGPGPRPQMLLGAVPNAGGRACPEVSSALTCLSSRTWPPTGRLLSPVPSTCPRQEAGEGSAIPALVQLEQRAPAADKKMESPGAGS